jgi:protein O-GlcNAc transferase
MADPTDISAALKRIKEQAERGLLDAAVASCQEVILSAPQEPEAWAWRGLLMLARERFAEAETAFRQALALQPANPHYLTYVSAAVRGQGQPSEAENFARQALAIDSLQAPYWVNLGAALADQQRWPEAAEAYRQAVVHNPQDAAAWRALAVAEEESAHLDAAQEAFERSLAVEPRDTKTIVGYAFLLTKRGQPQQAIQLLQDVVARAPQVAMAWVVLCRAHELVGDMAQAEIACRRALVLAPRLRESRRQLIDLLARRWAVAEAEAEARQLVADEPKFAAGWFSLGAILHGTGRADESIAALNRSLELEADPSVHSRLVAALQYTDRAEPEMLLHAHREWNEKYARALAPIAPPTIRQEADHKLTLGFVSADFYQHPTAFLVLPVLEQLKKTDCRVACYSDRIVADPYTARFRAAADVWRETASMTDQEVANQVRKDDVDILIDLAGHAGNRLLVFARQPAPLQITWFGYVGTTGLSTMDYLLADRFHVRLGEKKWYTEAILRMPHGYACYGPPPDAPPVGPLPALSSSHVTLGSFNHSAKLAPSTLDAWAAILCRVPAARLLLRFGGGDDKSVQMRLRKHVVDRGVNPERIRFGGWVSIRELLASYDHVDLALDTQPYSGGVTTCEALWMGVPVISFPGQTFAGRHATSHLTNAGYPQFVAENVEGYIELAVSWAGRLDELAIIRSQMREQVRRSPLCDAPRFAADLVAVLTQAWDACVARK